MSEVDLRWIISACIPSVPAWPEWWQKSLASHCSFSKPARSCSCLERGELLSTLWGTPFPRTCFPKPAGCCHSRAILMCKRSQGEAPAFPSSSLVNASLKVTGGLPGSGVYARISNVSGGFTCRMAAGFAKVSSHLAAGLLLLLQG